MKRRLSFSAPIVAVLIIALLGAACSSTSSDASSVAASQSTDTSSNGSDSEESAPDTDQPAGAGEPAGGGVDQGGTAMAASSPIGAFFSDDGGFDAAIAEYTLQVQESIVVCMAEQGFEFVAGGTIGDNEVTDRQSDLTVREWTNEFGFGISTSFDTVARNQAQDPNVAIFFGLSDGEREIWALTLNGIGLAGFGGDGPVDNSRPLVEQGCIGRGIIETGGQGALEGLGDLGDIREEGEAALLEGREMVEAITAWSRCMSEAGFTGYAELEDPEDDIEGRLTPIVAPIGAALQALEPGEGQAIFSGESVDLDKVPGLDAEALRELQADEINLAIADLDCYEAEVQAIYDPLLAEFENGLLVEYADEFAAVRDLGR